MCAGVGSGQRLEACGACPSLGSGLVVVGGWPGGAIVGSVLGDKSCGDRSRPSQQGQGTFGWVICQMNLIFYSLDKILISESSETCLACKRHTAPICLFDEYTFFYLHILYFVRILLSSYTCSLFEWSGNILTSGKTNSLPNIKYLRIYHKSYRTRCRFVAPQKRYFCLALTWFILAIPTKFPIDGAAEAAFCPYISGW